MMALIFILLLITTLVIWSGKRIPALVLFAITLACSIGLFLHHVTSSLSLQL